MRKGLLLKYVAKEATEQEQQEVLAWANKCARNMDYLVELKNTYISSHMPSDLATEQEMWAFTMEIARREMRQKEVASRNRYRIFSLISTAAAAVAIIAFILKPDSFSRQEVKESLLCDIREGRVEVALSDLPQASLQTVYTEKGVKSSIILPDGSCVKLNSDSKITYPVKFIGSTREVLISGEAYFNVVSDSLHPMIVTTVKGSKIKVLGTEFNVKSYVDDAEETTTLYSGKIALIAGGSNSEKVLLPTQQAVVGKCEKVNISRPVALSDTKAWTEGKIIFDETPLDEVVKMLERWHGVEITIRDSKILKYNITASFESESIYQIMYIIKNCALVDYTIDGKKVTLFAR
jgi:ferric-dicitrate binding protein FerR (iron transport regulator)